jgi:hypothetical protein
MGADIGDLVGEDVGPFLFDEARCIFIVSTAAVSGSGKT